MDSGLVQAETVRGLSEELMITAPRYWLAPALVALGAWMRGDPRLAGKAVAEAVSRDPDKAALFFLLVLQRWRRDDAVAQWIERYVDHLDPLELAPEFRIMLDATTTGLFGHAARARVADTVRRWTDGLRTHPSLAEKQVRRWTAVIEGLRSTAPDRPALRAHSPDWTRLVDLAGRANVFANADDFLDAALTPTDAAADGLDVRVDAVLDRLTGDFDRDEAPLRHRAADLQAVVDHDGDLEAARRARAGAAAGDPTTDFLSLLGDAALDDDTVAPPATRRLAIVLSRPWATAAVERIADQLRAEWPTGITIRHDGWQGVLDEENSDEALITQACQHHDQRTADEVAAVRFGGLAWLGVLAGALGLALGVLALVYGHLVPGIVALVVAVVAGLWVYSEYTALPGRRARAVADGERRKEQAEDVIRTTAAEGVGWLDDFEAALTAADALRDRLATLDVDDHLGSPQADRPPALAP